MKSDNAIPNSLYFGVLERDHGGGKPSSAKNPID